MQTKCSQCDAMFKVPDEYKGRKIKCPTCEQSFVVTEFITPSDTKKSDDSSKKVSSSTTKTKKCPFCGEEIQSEATKCRFCGEWLGKKALKKCKECGKPISPKAKKCPNCGVPIKKSSSLMNALGVLLFVAIFFGAIGTCFDSDSTKTKKPQASSHKLVVKEEEKIIEIRTCSKDGIKTIDVIKGAKGNVIKVLEGIEAINIRTGPGMNYKQDETGPLWKEEKLYVLEELDGWIRFRVTLEDQGWSAWVPKNFTVSVKEVYEKRVAKFGKPPQKSAWDGSVACVKRHLKAAVNDPDSLKFDFWSDVYYNDKDGWIVKCEFRAKNAFGAYVRDSRWFVIQDGYVVEVRESPQSQSDTKREKQLNVQKRYEEEQFALLSKVKQAQVLYMKKWLEEEAKPEDIGKLNKMQKQLIEEVALLRRIAQPLMEEYTRMMLQRK